MPTYEWTYRRTTKNDNSVHIVQPAPPDPSRYGQGTLWIDSDSGAPPPPPLDPLIAWWDFVEPDDPYISDNTGNVYLYLDKGSAGTAVYSQTDLTLSNYYTYATGRDYNVIDTAYITSFEVTFDVISGTDYNIFILSDDSPYMGYSIQTDKSCYVRINSAGELSFETSESYASNVVLYKMPMPAGTVVVKWDFAKDTISVNGTVVKTGGVGAPNFATEIPHYELGMTDTGDAYSIDDIKVRGIASWSHPT